LGLVRELQWEMAFGRAIWYDQASHVLMVCYKVPKSKRTKPSAEEEEEEEEVSVSSRFRIQVGVLKTKRVRHEISNI